MELSLQSKDFKALLKTQIATDLNILLSQYKNRDIGIRIVGEKTSIGEKTLKRIIGRESIPHTNTVRSFYSYFFKIHSCSGEVHQQIKKMISRESISSLLVGHDYKLEDSHLSQVLAENKVFREIYLYSRTGFITQSWVQKEYGKYGQEIVRFMLDENILLEIDKNIYVQGPINIPKNSTALKKILEDLLGGHLDKEKLEVRGQNSAFFVIEGISEKAKREVIDKIEECKNDVAKIMFNKNNRGDHRVFMLAAIDELEFENNDLNIH